MALSSAEVDHIAALARIDLTDKEKAMYAEQLSAIFAYIAMLNEVDTSAEKETCQVTGLEDIVREDVAEDAPDEVKEKLIEAFPERLGQLLKVKGVFK